jgi:hypothetical protein
MELRANDTGDEEGELMCGYANYGCADGKL